MNSVLTVSGLKVSRQGRRVLQGIDLELKAGEAAVLSGLNGCGKTTMLRTVAGLLDYEAGRITVHGTDIASVSWKGRRHSLAYVSQEQESRAFPVRVYEMAATGLAARKITARERRERVEKALADTGCLELKERYYFSLSGGERQRVALARCLCQGASLLLLDEPLTYLDRDGRRAFTLLLERIRKEYAITILLVTHTDDELSNVDWRRLRLSEGRLSEDRLKGNMPKEEER